MAESLDAFNAHLRDACTKRGQAILRGHTLSIAERMQADLASFMKLPAAPYDACDKIATRVSSLSLVRCKNNDYSVPARYGHQEVLAKGYVDRLESAGMRRSPCIRAAMREPILSTTRCIIRHCWNTKPRRLIKRRPWMIGGLRIAFIGCGG